MASTINDTTIDIQEDNVVSLPEDRVVAFQEDSAIGIQDDGKQKGRLYKRSNYTKLPNFSETEDLIVTKAFLVVSEDSLNGVKQKQAAIMKKLADRYSQMCCDTYNAMLSVAKSNPQMSIKSGALATFPNGFPERPANSLWQRWKKCIQPDLHAFAGVVNSTPFPSGANNETYKELCFHEFKEQHKKDFKYWRCWEAAKSSAKFEILLNQWKDSAGRVASSKGEKRVAAGVGSKENRPDGCKASKKMKLLSSAIADGLKGAGFGSSSLQESCSVEEDVSDISDPRTTPPQAEVMVKGMMEGFGSIMKDCFEVYRKDKEEERKAYENKEKNYEITSWLNTLPVKERAEVVKAMVIERNKVPPLARNNIPDGRTLGASVEGLNKTI